MEIALDVHLDARRPVERAGELLDGGHARRRCKVGILPLAKDADDQPHLRERPGGFVLDHRQGIDGGVRIRLREIPPGLGTEDDGGHVMGDAVVQVTGEMLALPQPDLLEAALA